MSQLVYHHDHEFGAWFNPDSLETEFVLHGEAAEEDRLARLQSGQPAGTCPAEIRRFRIEVTDRCNASCTYCLVSGNDLDDVSGHMTEATADAILALAAEHLAPRGDLLLMGGEPFTNWRVVEQFVRSFKGRVILFTNGTLVTPERADFLARHGTVLLVSMDGRRAHSRARRFPNGREMYDSALGGYRLLKEAGVEVGIGCLVTDGMVRDVPDIARWFRDELQPAAIGFSLPHFEETGQAVCDVDAYAEALVSVFHLCKRQGPYIPQVAQRLRPLLMRQARRHGCMIADGQWTFMPDGERVLCSKLSLLPHGWKLDAAEELSRWSPLEADHCQQCDYYKVCGGGCFWDGFKRFEIGLDLRECRILERLVPEMLIDMSRQYHEVGPDWMASYAAIAGSV